MIPDVEGAQEYRPSVAGGLNCGQESRIFAAHNTKCSTLRMGSGNANGGTSVTAEVADSVILKKQQGDEDAECNIEQRQD
jgi:hypothetical protein